MSNVGGTQAPQDHVSVRMTPEQSLDFVERLASDDDFRSRVQDDPTAVFREYGMDIPRNLLPQQIELPKSEELNHLLETLKSGRSLNTVPNVYPALFGFWFLFLLFRKD